MLKFVFPRQEYLTIDNNHVALRRKRLHAKKSHAYPAAVVAPLALLSPVTGVVVSALVFGERFTPLRYAGMALIVAGLAVIVLRAPRRTITPPVPRMD